jgi:uncharacterized SAM-dependent methyltransferase
MKYFKNTELAKLYSVSEKTVRNWIQAAKDGKLELQLHEKDGKFWVANTTKNNALIAEQVSKGKKFKNSRGLKVLNAPNKFYKTYTKKQILDIITHLTVHKEIPLQYGYVDGGAESWDLYANRLVQEQTPNVLSKTIDLLELNAAYIDKLVGSNRKVNVVDLGPGNGLAARATLERLHKQGRLNRYIAIDISPEMLDIVERNIKEWFNGEVMFEKYVRDFSEERFNDLFIEDYTGDDEDTPANLVFMFGGTLSNFRLPDHVLRIINSSLGPNDLFFVSGYLDTPYNRRYFDLSGEVNPKKDPQQSGLIPSFLQIDDTLCDFDLEFKEEAHSRIKSMKPKLDLVLNFEVENKSRHVELRKGEPVLLWRHRHYNYGDVVGLFASNDFDMMQATKSEDQNYFLLISKIKVS